MEIKNTVVRKALVSIMSIVFFLMIAFILGWTSITVANLLPGVAIEHTVLVYSFVTIGWMLFIRILKLWLSNKYE